MAATPRSPRRCSIAIPSSARWGGRADLDPFSGRLAHPRGPRQHHRGAGGREDMSLDDFTRNVGARPAIPTEVVGRIDRASAVPGKTTRAEELRLQLADEIVRGALPPGAALDETEIAQRFS